ncbi:hypothetical protein QAD02_010518 [Eretmocerus hayati]|uniref:Uncharacterized protein n=1 Tax=Eretmocerus hayati TaxID=131215 RepID=A0ACC2NUG4_9HYME|nr:hypothetical protein QAD02_010518 [Eretmocerus hayati]
MSGEEEQYDETKLDTNAITKKPGTTPKVPPDNIFEVLKDMPIFNESGKLEKQSEKVWNKARIALKNAITVKYLHLIVSTNRYKLKTRLVDYKKSLNLLASADEPLVCQTQSNIPKDTLRAINCLKSDVMLKPMFKGTGASPFHQFYWFPDQKNLWKNYINNSNGAAVICKFDTIVDRAYVGDVLTDYVSLYALFTHCDKVTIPFIQFIAEDQNDDLLEFCIDEFLREIVPALRSILIDISMLDMMNTLFNECDINDYNGRILYSYMTGNEYPPTLIKIDAFLVISYLNDLFNDQYQIHSITIFFIQSIIFLSTVSDYETLTEALKNLILISISDRLYPCTMTARRYYLDATDNRSIKDLFETYKKYEVRSSSKNDLVEFISNNDFSQSIIYNALLNTKKYLDEDLKLIIKKDSYRINSYRNQKNMDSVLKVFSLYPLWTNVPQIDRNSPHEYQNLKDLYRDQQLSFVPRNEDESLLRLPPEEFLVKHAIFLSSSFSLLRQIISTDINNDGNQNVSNLREIRFFYYLNFFENWKNRANRSSFEKEQKEIHDNEKNCEITSTVSDHSSEKTGDNVAEAISNSCSENTPKNASIHMNHDYLAFNEPTGEMSHSTPEKIANPNRKRRKYLDACPTLKVIYNLPKEKNKFKDCLIKNGNMFDPKKIACSRGTQSSKKKVNFTPLRKLGSTCLFDSLVELFAHSIRNFNDFYVYCQNIGEENDLIRITFNLATSNKLIQFYKERDRYFFSSR